MRGRSGGRRGSACDVRSALPDLSTARGGLTAVDSTTGRVKWERRLPAAVFGAATVSNDVVFTSTWDGTIYGFALDTGRLLWSAQARAGINSFPAVDDDQLLVGASAPGFFAQPISELIAFSIG